MVDLAAPAEMAGGRRAGSTSEASSKPTLPEREAEPSERKVASSLVDRLAPPSKLE